MKLNLYTIAFLPHNYHKLNRIASAEVQAQFLIMIQCDVHLILET